MVIYRMYGTITTQGLYIVILIYSSVETDFDTLFQIVRDPVLVCCTLHFSAVGGRKCISFNKDKYCNVCIFVQTVLLR